MRRTPAATHASSTCRVPSTSTRYSIVVVSAGVDDRGQMHDHIDLVTLEQRRDPLGLRHVADRVVDADDAAARHSDIRGEDVPDIRMGIERCGHVRAEEAGASRDEDADHGASAATIMPTAARRRRRSSRRDAPSRSAAPSRRRGIRIRRQALRGGAHRTTIRVLVDVVRHALEAEVVVAAREVGPRLFGDPAAELGGGARDCARPRPRGMPR